MPRSRIVLACSGWLTLAATLLPAGAAPRVLAVWVFALVCPGAAFVWRAAAGRRSDDRRPDRLETVVVAVALSLAASTLVSEGLYLTNTFPVPRAIAALAAVTTVAALWPANRTPRTI
jgi:hypothetical protein